MDTYRYSNLIKEKTSFFYKQVLSSQPATIILYFVAAAVVFRWFYFISEYTVNILFWDQWDFYKAFFNDYDVIQIYTHQHGPHRQGIGFLLTDLINAVSNWNIRWIGFTGGLLSVFTAIIYLIIKKGLYKELKAFDYAIVFIVVLTPLQHAIFSNTPNLSHGPMPSFLLSLYCLSFLIQNRYYRLMAILVLHFLLIYSGFGIFIGAITPVVLILEGYEMHKIDNSQSRVFLYAFSTIISLLIVALFFIDYRFAPANPNFQFPHNKPIEYLYFIILGIGNVMNQKYFLGTISLFFLIYILALHLVKIIKSRDLNNSRHSKIIIVLITFSLLFISNTAIGRISFGINTASASRYVPYMIPAIIAVYLHILSIKSQWKYSTLIVFFMIQLYGTSYVKSEINAMRKMKEQKTKWVEVYIETEDIHLADSLAGRKIYPFPEKTRLKEKMTFLKKNKLNLYNKN